MATLFNHLDCTSQAAVGTGLADCEVSLDAPSGFILVPTNWEVDPSAIDVNGAYIKNEIAARRWHPFNNAVDYIENNEETVFKTYNRGIKSQVRKGLPEFDFIFNNGVFFHAAATSFDSFQGYKVIFVHDNGVLQAGLKTDLTTITGMDLGYIDTATWKNADGAEPNETMIKMQLTSANQYNSRKAIIQFANNNIDSSDIQGVVEARITPDLPLDTATTLSVAVKAAANRSINVLGLAAANFAVTGKTVTAAVYNATTEKYDLTTDAFATADTFTVSLTDGTNPSVDLSGVVYAGTSNAQTVA